jgi:DNA adenine methylase
MNIKTMKKTPITWYGGKQGMLKYILPIIPEHKIYVEPFFGGGAVYFSKPPVKCEIINDVNKEATNFYYTAKVNFKDLKRYVSTTLHSRTSYKDADVIYTNPHLFSNVQRAWAFHTMANQSFSANFSSFGFDRVGTTVLKIHNKRNNFIDEIQERLSLTTIENDDAVKVITRYDTPEAFIYVDPPYFNSNCGQYSGYTEAQFTQLLDTLTQVKGRFLMSSYPSDVLARFTKKHKWETAEVEKRLAVHPGAKGKKIEVLTANYPIREAVEAIKAGR